MRSSMNMFCVVCGLAILSLCAGVASAATIYVDDDNTSGPWDGSSSHPYQYIQDGIDAASDGDTVYVSGGTYYENVVVDRSIALIGQGRDNTTVDGGGNDDAIGVVAESVLVSGFTLANAEKGIDVDSNHCTISDNIITGTSNQGIHLISSSYHTILTNTFSNNEGSDLYMRNSSYNTVTGNTFESEGISCGGTYNTITDNAFLAGGIEVARGNLNYWTSHTIENNYVNGRPIYYYKNIDTPFTVPTDAAQVILANCRYVSVSGLNTADLLNVVQLGHSSYNTVSDNTFADPKHGVTMASSSKNNTISGNTITGSSDAGIVVYSDENEISGNVVMNGTQEGIQVWSYDNVIQGNVLDGNNEGVALIGLSDYTVVVGNTITNNACGISSSLWVLGHIEGNTITENGWGIFLGWSRGNTIANNTITGNTDGVVMYDAIENVFTGNDISGNSGDGIELRMYSYEGSYFNILYGNRIADNGNNGIRICNSGPNTIFGNDIRGNLGNGVFMEDMYRVGGNNIYHNNFVDNTVTAYDQYAPNTWDDGYPSGGNYWDDFDGVDNFSGPDQNIPRSDGIGDTAYSIPGGVNEDGYPLMNPYLSDVGTIAVVSPPETVSVDATYTPQAQIRNFGPDTVVSFPVICAIDTNGVELYVDTAEVTSLPGGNDVSVPFADWMVPVGGITYSITIWTAQIGDPQPTNDTTVQVIHSIVASFVRADVDANMDVEMSDAISLLVWLYIPGSPAPMCMDCVDSDDDGEISMGDGVYILKYLYVPDSPEPPAPFPDCGVDPTEDELECASHPCFGIEAVVAKGTGNLGGKLTLAEPKVDGDQAVVPVVLNSTADLSAFAYTIEYDPSCVVAKSLRNEGTISESFDFFSAKPEEGKITVGNVVSLTMQKRLPPGQYHVGDITFEFISEVAENSELRLVEVQLVNPQANVLSCQTHDVTINPRFRLGMPKVFALKQAFPNPFTGKTSIKYAIPKDGHVHLKIYNSAGQSVSTLVNEEQQPGYYRVDWNGKDTGGMKVASGVYFYRIDTGDHTATKKMILLK